MSGGIHWIGWGLGAAGVLLGALAGLLLWRGPGLVESALQGVVAHAPYAIGSEARALHASLRIVDWHADSLLWKRDLLQRSTRGQLDFPRLEAGNVAVQMFTTVTRSPRGQNYRRNSATRDNITLLALLEAWPASTWSSRLARALHQAERLRAFAERAPDRVQPVRSAADLREILRRRASGERTVAALLGLEGAQALEERIENLDVLYDAGFRMVGLHHFLDNELGGSLHGESRAGLSDFGRQVVRRAEARKMIVDVAHSSPAVVDDVLEMARRPIVVSHTGVYGACPSPRNLPDEQIRRIARAGGLIAIGYWEGAVCDIRPRGVVASLRYAIDLVGVDHVALGSDFDGAVTTAFDASELAVLTQEMLDAGFGDDEIAKVMGENSLRFLLEQLAGEDPPP